MSRPPESQKVQAGDGPGAHGEDVAQNPAYARCRALIGLDERRVVMAFHLEDAGVAIADVDDAGVLAGAANHPGRLGRKLAQVDARGLIGTMLVPHGRENAELGEARRAADEFQDALIFLGLEAMGDGQLRRDGGFGRAHKVLASAPLRRIRGRGGRLIGAAAPRVANGGKDYCAALEPASPTNGRRNGESAFISRRRKESHIANLTDIGRECCPRATTVKNEQATA